MGVARWEGDGGEKVMEIRGRLRKRREEWGAGMGLDPMTRDLSVLE